MRKQFGSSHSLTESLLPYFHVQKDHGIKDHATILVSGCKPECEASGKVFPGFHFEERGKNVKGKPEKPMVSLDCFSTLKTFFFFGITVNSRVM